VPLGHSIDYLMEYFWIIVSRVAKPGDPVCFIMKLDEVQRLAHRGAPWGVLSLGLRKPPKSHGLVAGVLIECPTEPVVQVSRLDRHRRFHQIVVRRSVAVNCSRSKAGCVLRIMG